jgi:tetratricopeptide (TPR) repeat protein
MCAFPETQTNRLQQLFEEEGFISRDFWDDNFRFDIISKPDLVVFLGSQIPIRLPVKNQPPLEICTFNISIGCRPRELNDMTVTLFRFIINSFREKIINLPPYTHDFNIRKYDSKIQNFIEKYFPNPAEIDEETLKLEKKFTLHIRDRILHSPEFTEKYNIRLSQDVLDCYHYFHLAPIDELPPELSKGLPTGRENQAIFFKNMSNNDMLIEEPGMVTYWRDYNYKNIWIRTSMQTYAPFILYQIFDDQEYRFNYLLYDWLVYCRALIKEILPIFDAEQYHAADMVPFSEITLLQNIISTITMNALPLSPLVYEMQISEHGNQMNRELFEGIPQTLEELKAIQDFKTSRILIQRGNYGGGENLLLNARKSLKKFHHTPGIIAINSKLIDLYIEQEKYTEALKILTEALELVKTGKVPIPELVKIHISFNHIYHITGEFDKGLEHFNIIEKFLSSLPNSNIISNQMCRIYLAMIKTKQKCKQYKEVEPYYKEAFKLVSDIPLFKFLFYYERSHFYAGTGNEQKQIEMLEKALDIPEGPIYDYVNAQIELGQILNYNKLEPQKAIKLLNEALKINQHTDFGSMKLKIKTYEILADAYIAVKNQDAAQQAQQEANILRDRIDKME